MPGGLFSAFNANVRGMNGISERFKAHAQNLSSAGVFSSKVRTALLTSLQIGGASDSSFTPSGISAKPVQFIDVAGAPSAQDVPTYLSIGKSGFFVVNDNANNTTPGTFGFTRLGSFSPDENGNLKNHADQFLKIFKTDSAGVPVATDITTFSELKTANISNLLGSPQATNSLKWVFNAKSTEPVLATAQQFPQIVYDALGNTHSLQFSLQKTAEVADTSQTWTLTITSPEPGVTVGAPYAAGVPIVFDNAGRLLSINGNAAAPPANNAPALDITTWGNAAAPATGANAIAIDFGMIGDADGSSAIGAQYIERTKEIDGVSMGTFLGVRIEDDGKVIASFNNGAELIFGRIPLAAFDNINGLQEMSGNVYVQSQASGPYRLNFPKDGNVGSITPNALEESTIDTGTVFTEMIVDQKRYTANLKAIASVEKLLDALEQILGR